MCKNGTLALPQAPQDPMNPNPSKDIYLDHHGGCLVLGLMLAQQGVGRLNIAHPFLSLLVGKIIH